MFVDDVDINSTGETAEATSHEVIRATRRLLTEFERVLGLKVGIHKSVLLGSTSGVRRRLMDAMRALPRERRIPVQVWGKKLGVQYSIQNRRQAAFLTQRRQQASARASRMKDLRSTIPRRARNSPYNSAVRPVATYGGSCLGLRGQQCSCPPQPSVYCFWRREQIPKHFFGLPPFA